VSTEGRTEQAKYDPAGNNEKPGLKSYIRNPHSFSTQNHALQGKTGSTKSQQPSTRILLSERLVGSFHRTFTFPNDVKEEAIKATLKDGVLDLQIPKKEEIHDT
jgi:hypothetical protein